MPTACGIPPLKGWEEVNVSQSVLDGPAEIGLSVYNTAADANAFFDRVVVS
jgi:hypothetical protein